MTFCFKSPECKEQQICTCVSTQSEMQGFPKYFFLPLFFNALKLGTQLQGKAILKQVSLQLQCFTERRWSRTYKNIMVSLVGRGQS